MNKNKIYLAALLHDIGKFWQRADVYDKVNKQWQDLDQSVYKAENYCPAYKGNYSHKHVLWTAQFIEQKLKMEEKSEGEESLLLLSAMHHNPGKNQWYNLITLADHLSSGMDRNQLTQDALEENQIEDTGNYKKTPLRSIFSIISRDEKEYLKYRMPVQILDAEHIMPIDKEVENIEQLYRDTWNKFVGEIDIFRNFYQNDRIYTREAGDTLLYLMQKYTSYIPSSTQDLPDVSLYDHSKTTAAFAVCLYDYLKEKDKNVFSIKPEQEKPFLLVGADLSGIQNYIYNIVSKNASKNLKGRSFYLHLITTTIVKKILDETELFEANVIYNSGGGFFMLLPNTENVNNQLNKIEREIQKELYEKFGGKLYLSLARVPFGTHDILGGEEEGQPKQGNQLSEVWKQLFEQIGQKKQRRFLDLILNEQDQSQAFFFEPFGQEGENVEKDVITGEQIRGSYKNLEIGKISPLTFEQIEIGKKLKFADYWLIQKGEKREEADTYFLGYNHFLFDEEELKSKKRFTDIQGGKLLKFNKTDFLKFNENLNLNVSAGFEFYGGNTYPLDENGEPKTYDQLPKGAYNKNAVVKMDVDNLGYLFQFGFKPHQRTFSRYSQLSRNLDLFFKGFITHLWKNNEDYKNHTVIVYAGGDDMFFLGDWQTTIHFAEEIRNKFREYVCQHPLITLSGGMVITPPKYPILKMAERCDEEEKTGKSYEWKNTTVRYLDKDGNFYDYPKKKDAVGFLGEALAWDLEYQEVKKMAEIFKEKIDHGEFPHALLHKLMNYYEMSGLPKDGKITENRFYWLMSYDFGRMKERIRKKNKEENQEFLNGILNDCLQNQWEDHENKSPHHSLKLYALAARWAELQLRDEKKHRKLENV